MPAKSPRSTRYTGRLHEPVETRSRGFENGAEVREHLLRLLSDRAAHQLRLTGLESHLAGDEHEAAGHDRLRYGAP